MGKCYYNCMYNSRLCPLFVSFLLLAISSSKHQRVAQGRPLIKNVRFSQVTVSDDKASLRAQIGSMPPRCERRCNNCGPCEAIQVPTNPQVKPGGRKSSTSISTIAYARREDNSNYKPLSWKCKCGDYIYNP